MGPAATPGSAGTRRRAESHGVAVPVPRGPTPTTLPDLGGAGSRRRHLTWRHSSITPTKIPGSVSATVCRRSGKCRRHIMCTTTTGLLGTRIDGAVRSGGCRRTRRIRFSSGSWRSPGRRRRFSSGSWRSPGTRPTSLPRHAQHAASCPCTTTTAGTRTRRRFCGGSWPNRLRKRGKRRSEAPEAAKMPKELESPEAGRFTKR
mmetsp:Transcript_1639/g.6451  ORF Transcript_1639/g.6451 Transcript_1639/m.6451 type:complete len:203 (+) Transcript_1639:102-710(+)